MIFFGTFFAIFTLGFGFFNLVPTVFGFGIPALSTANVKVVDGLDSDGFFLKRDESISVLSSSSGV